MFRIFICIFIAFGAIKALDMPLDSILKDSTNKNTQNNTILFQEPDIKSFEDSNFNYYGEYLQNPFALLPFGAIKKNDNRIFLNPTPKKTMPTITPKIPKIDFKNTKKPLKITIEKKAEIKIEKPQDYDSKFKHLMNLRYEVFSLKQQLGDDINNADIPYGAFVPLDSSASKYNALAQSYNDASAKSGFFGGASFGIMDIYTSGCIKAGNRAVEINGQITEVPSCNATTTHSTPIVFGGSGGYQRFFNHYIGTRLWGGIFSTLLANVQEYNINNGMYENKLDLLGQSVQSYYLLAHMSADLLFEFPISKRFNHYIGAFAGINIGVMYYRPFVHRTMQGDYYPADYIWSYNLQVDYSLNVGFNVTLFNKNRLEISMALPLAFLELPGFKQIASGTYTGSESDIFVSSQNMITTPPKPDFWRGALFAINFKRLIF